MARIAPLLLVLSLFSLPISLHAHALPKRQILAGHSSSASMLELTPVPTPVPTLVLTLVPTSTSTPQFPPTPTGTPALRISVSIPDDIQPVIDQDFPDPDIICTGRGEWFAYATNSNHSQVQIAKAHDPFGPWTFLARDAKPALGWTSGINTWAPDVQDLTGDGNGYLMYYAGLRAGVKGGKHCLGAARSYRPEGPFQPDPEPFLCHDDAGGVIDVSGFVDPASGRRYIVYKLEVSLTVEGVTYDTPIMLCEVDADGTTLIGAERVLLWRVEEDGPLVEAPQIVARNGAYVLFFSSHNFLDTMYDTKYAVAESLDSPFIRGGQIISRAVGGLDGPGGAQSARDLNVVAFHGWCVGRADRCMYVAEYTVSAW